MGFAERCGLLQNCISGALGTSDIMYIHTCMLYMYLAYTAPALRLRCASVALVFHMCCICVSHVLHLCFTCVALVFHMCCICVSHVFHMCFTCVALVFHMCCICVSHVLHLCFTCVALVFHMCCTCVSHVLHLCFTCVALVFHMCCTCVSHVLHLCFTCVALVFHMCCICVVYVLCLHCIWVVFALLSIFLVGTVGPSLQSAWYSNYSRHHDSEHKSCWFVERSAVHMHLDSHVHGLTFKHIYPYMGACTCSMYVN